MIKKLIFLLEDSNVFQKKIRNCFEDIADLIVIDSIKKAEEYLDIIKNESGIECFILDVVLLDGESFSIVKKIRSMEVFNSVPIIFHTSNLTNNIPYRGMEMGVNETVSKMSSVFDLKNIVLKQIEKPYIKKVKRENYVIHCLKWESEENSFLYCPDINKVISGKSPEGVEEEMKRVLKETIAANQTDIKEISTLSITSFVLDIE